MAKPVANAGASSSYVFGDLPIAEVQLAGSATGGTGVYSSWKWHLIGKPSGSAAALDDSTLQNPKLLNVDRAGTYLLFLAVTDNAAVKSETTRQLAPVSAYTACRVSTEHAALRRPSEHEKDYIDAITGLIDHVDDLRGDFIAQKIEDHDTNATGAELDELVGGGSTLLHVHPGTSVPAATTVARGTVKLSDAPVDAGNPRAVTRKPYTIEAVCNGSMTSDGWKPGTIEPQTGGAWSECHWVRVVPALYTASLFVAAFLDGGAGGGAYTVEFYQLLQAEFATNDFAAATAANRKLATISVASDSGKPTVNGAVPANPIVAEANSYLAVRITGAPPTPGGGLCISIDGEKAY
jgi:hypothetical protein